MHQLLFVIPGLNVPIYGFGAMLVTAFLACGWWAGRRAKPLGMSPDHVQDLAFVLFLSGIIGARLFYILQFNNQFKFEGLGGLIAEFIAIDRGGIVFYGCLVGGLVGFLGFRHFVLKRLNVSTWALADVIAPLLALGLAIGRIGCYLNGCCWGQVAVPECQPVPFAGPACRMPLATSPIKDHLLKPGGNSEPRPHCRGVQTGTGFVVMPRLDGDPRSVVVSVEPGSDAERAGLKAGDLISTVNGFPNDTMLVLNGERSAVQSGLDLVKTKGKLESHKPVADTGLLGCHRSKAESGDWLAIITFDEPRNATMAKRLVDPLRPGLSSHIVDRYIALQEDWPRGETALALGVKRGEESITITFTPRSVTLFPTPLYESLSMILLMLVILAWQPFKRHDGQLMVIWLIGYGIHRFLNESIRVEPIYSLGGIQLGLTASQWISIGIALGGIILEFILRRIQPRKV